jgi:hypothetical protein
MKRKHRILLAAAMLTAVSSTVFYACKKPTDGFEYVINSTVFNYTASLRFVDPANNNAVPAGVKVTAQGTIASQVYDISGFKNLQVSNQGVVTFGLAEQAQPTTQDVPVTFLVEATGYRTESVTVIFKKGKPNIPVEDVQMLNLAKASEGVAVKVETVPVSGSTVTAPVVIAPPPPAPNLPPATQSAEVTIPANTQLRDAAGNAVNTTSISVVVANIDVEKPTALDFFPNNSLVQNAVINNVVQKVAFATAGVVTIEIKAANGTAITNFSQPIQVKTTLDPTTINPNTGAPIQAGDALDYYSYTTATNTWKYEASGVVSNINGVLQTNIPVTHLSTWICVVKPTVSFVCNVPNVPLTINGSNIPAQSTDKYTIELFSKSLGKLIGTLETTISQADNKDTLNDLTTGDIILTILDPLGKTVGQATINLCSASGGTINLDLPPADVTNPLLTIKITAKCAAGQLKNVYSSQAPQGVVIYYKESSPVTNPWLPLGSVTAAGTLVTNVLNKTKTYDFMSSFTLPDGSKVAPTKTGQVLNTLNTTSPGAPDFVFKQELGSTTATIDFKYTVPSKYCQ